MINKTVDNLELNINGTPIEKVLDFNFLGLTLNENLNWKNHIDKIAIKCSKTSGIINKLKRMLPESIKLLLYNTLFLPHINYSILVWGYNCERIIKLQKRTIRLLNVSKYNAHTDHLFKKFKLLKVKDILKVQGLKFYYKLIHHKLPAYLQNLQLLTNSNIHSHNTRGNTDIHIRRVTHTFAKNSLRHNIPTLINNAPNSIKAKLITHSIHGFSNYVKKLSYTRLSRTMHNTKLVCMSTLTVHLLDTEIN